MRASQYMTGKPPFPNKRGSLLSTPCPLSDAVVVNIHTYALSLSLSLFLYTICIYIYIYIYFPLLLSLHCSSVHVSFFDFSILHFSSNFFS
ncbi:hypothetical protein BCR43DRAFT_498915, partial [Syncephalastrum racemosum]